MKRITIDLEAPFDYGAIGMTFIGIHSDVSSLRTCTLDIQQFDHVRVANDCLEIGRDVSQEVDLDKIKTAAEESYHVECRPCDQED